MEKTKQYKRKDDITRQITDATGKLPPRDTDLEEVVLGACMLEKDAYMNVCDVLVPDSFYDVSNQKIFQAISTLGLNQKPIDLMTVTEQLRQDGTLDEVGGAIRIAELTARVYSAANVEYHAKIVAQKYLARRLISFAAQIETKAFDESNDVDDLLQEAETAQEGGDADRPCAQPGPGADTGRCEHRDRSVGPADGLHRPR